MKSTSRFSRTLLRIGAPALAVGMFLFGGSVVRADSVTTTVTAVGKIHTLDRARVRATFDRRFTARRMAEDYLDLYEELAQPARRLHAVTA